MIVDLNEAGRAMQDAGLRILPYSFAAYFPVRWLEYVWNNGFHRLVKGIWYFARHDIRYGQYRG